MRWFQRFRSCASDFARTAGRERVTSYLLFNHGKVYENRERNWFDGEDISSKDIRESAKDFDEATGETREPTPCDEAPNGFHEACGLIHHPGE